MSDVPAHTNDARIIDRSYRRYDGERTGIRGAIRTVVVHSIQRALGLRRSVWSKVFPVISIVIAYLPALAFVGIAAIFPVELVQEGILPSYGDYYGYVSLAIILFAAFVAPEMLCPDRRSGLLGIYLASSLTRNTYVVAKLIAAAITLLAVTTGPVLLLLISYSFEDVGPGSVGDWLTTLARILGGGLTIAALHASLSLAISSFTDRKAVASASIIGAMFVPSILVEIVVDTGSSDYFRLLDLLRLPFEMVQRIWGNSGDWSELSTLTVGAAYTAWTLASIAVLWWNYQRVGVRQ
ncbi:MAG: ABC transporter permease subunit [Actinomycetia bacterium]|nr:ABC transporter permease subunit [Actinomycetes bacterium]